VGMAESRSISDFDQRCPLSVNVVTPNTGSR
jgi:hypothetical protein